MPLVRFNKRGDGVSISIDVPFVPRIGEYVSIEGEVTAMEGDVHEVAHVIEADGGPWRVETRVILR